MNELVIMHDKQAVTTSLVLAEVFEKQHKNVIQAIEAKIEPAENQARYKRMFYEGIYTDKKGEQRKMYISIEMDLRLSLWVLQGVRQTNSN